MKVCYTQNDIAEMERDTNGNIIMPEVVEAYIEKPAEAKKLEAATTSAIIRSGSMKDNLMWCLRMLSKRVKDLATEDAPGKLKNVEVDSEDARSLLLRRLVLTKCAANRSTLGGKGKTATKVAFLRATDCWRWQSELERANFGLCYK